MVDIFHFIEFLRLKTRRIGILFTFFLEILMHHPNPCSQLIVCLFETFCICLCTGI